MKEQFPFISILVAARNEEANLCECLDSLLLLTYPNEKLEIWIGNDQSTDLTREIAESYALKHKQIKVINIEGNLGSARGKANVLAQLAQVSIGEWLLFTDADCKVNPLWAKTLVEAAVKSDAPMGIGVTGVHSTNLFEELQALDWLSAQGIMMELSKYQLPVTLVGNNMFVKRAAYFETGGYENLPHSVTEDYQLFREIWQRQKKFLTVWGTEALVETKPMKSFSAWLIQHQRWLVGALKTPFWVKGLFFGQLIFVYLLIGIGLYGYNWAFNLLIIRYLLSAGISWSVLDSLKMKDKWKAAMLYDFFFLTTYPLLLINGLKQRQIEWKGRKFKPL